jgi:hypothetical protein
MSDPDEPVDAELDLARIGLPPGSDVERLCQRLTDALMDTCREWPATATEPVEPRPADTMTTLEAARLGL